MTDQPYPSRRYTALLSRNMRRLVGVVDAEAALLTALSAGPQRVHDLARVIRRDALQTSRYLSDLKRRRLVICHHPRSWAAVWALPGTPKPITQERPLGLRQAACPRKPVTATVSWWTTADRAGFGATARRRTES